MSSFDLNHIYKYIKSKTGIVTKPTKIFYLSLLENNHNTHSHSHNSHCHCNSHSDDDDNDDNDNFTVFNKIPLGSTNVLQTSLSPLFKEDTLKNRIGTNSSTVTLLNYNKTTSQNLYNSSVSTVYRLNNGTIGISHAPLLENFGNFYGLPKNIYEIAPITFGTSDYLNKNGFVLIVTGNTTTKMILLYLIDSIVDKQINDCNETNTINFESIINLFIPNQNTQIIKKNNSLKVILNQTISTPGVLLSNIKVLSNIIKINFNIEISGNFNVNPFIKDLDGNIYYWINYNNYVIESTNKYIKLLLPNNLINNSINIYLLANSNGNKIKLNDSFTITNFSIKFA